MKPKTPKIPIVIAIDPGASGACAIKFDDCSIAIAVPFTSESDFLELMGDYAVSSKLEKRPVIVYIEQVGGFMAGNRSPGSAMFNFGRNFGYQVGVCQALGFKVVLVAPSVWQKKFPTKTKRKESGPQHKRELKDHAARLFPAARPTLATADALLILDYALEQECRP